MPAITVPVKVRWADLDPYGHVNNAAMLTLLEEVRIAVFWHGRGASSAPGAFGVGGASATFIARQEIEYVRPLGYPTEPVGVRVWVSKLGGASADVDYEVPDEHGEVAVRARSVVVLMDTATMRPRRLSETERAELGALMATPIAFRRGG